MGLKTKSIGILSILILMTIVVIPVMSKGQIASPIGYPPETPFWNNPEFVMALIVVIIGIIAIYIWRRWGFEDIEHVSPIL
ncbi:unnamed protein product [marine sediment metagenome]|uniref:Uncharacterized protein n=1 Tax=marine sediment metagenome TaxID=412755 RepID=X1BYH9_9ZZZZ